MKTLKTTAVISSILLSSSVLAATLVDAPTCYIMGSKCFITFNSISSDSPNLTFLRLAVDGVIVNQATDFFQASVSVPGDRFGAGFPVDCGAAGDGGFATMGARHELKIMPLDGNEVSLGTSTAYVWCPVK